MSSCSLRSCCGYYDRSGLRLGFTTDYCLDGDALVGVELLAVAKFPAHELTRNTHVEQCRLVEAVEALATSALASWRILSAR